MNWEYQALALASKTRLAVAHAPKGGVTIQGEFYPGGRFIPGVTEAEVEKAKATETEEKPFRGYDAKKLTPTYAIAPPGGIKIRRTQYEAGKAISKKDLDYASANELRELGFPDAVVKVRDYRDNGIHADSFKGWFGDWEATPEEASKAVNEYGRPAKTVEYSQVVDEEGEPIIVYHGTTHEFDEFNLLRSNSENHVGKAHYFTTSHYDANHNYAGMGPDLTNRVHNLSDQIEAALEYVSSLAREQKLQAYDREGGYLGTFEPGTKTEDIEEQAAAEGKEVGRIVGADQTECMEELPGIARGNETLSRWISMLPLMDHRMYPDDYNEREIAAKAAREILVGGDEKVMEVYLNIRKPFRIGTPGSGIGDEFRIEIDERDSEGRTPEDDDFDWNTAEFVGESGNGIKLIEAIRDVAGDFTSVGPDKIIADLNEPPFKQIRGSLADGISGSDVLTLLLYSNGSVYAEDKHGHLASGEFARRVIERLGYDGVEYEDASEFFPGMGISPGTKHYVAFNPEQIKAVSNIGTFDPKKKSIYMSSWSPYKGPRGGKGWKNDQTGDVLYQDEKPGNGENGEDKRGEVKLQKSVIPGRWGTEVKHRVLINGTTVGHIDGMEGYATKSDNTHKRTGILGEFFDLLNTELDTDVRGTGAFQKAVQQIANSYSSGVLLRKWQASEAVKRALRKLPHTENEEAIIVPPKKEPTDAKQKIKMPRTTGVADSPDVKMVPVEALKKLAREDRTKLKKSTDAIDVPTDVQLEKLTNAFRRGEALREPVMIHYDTDTKKAFIGDGNTRMAALEAAGYTHIPVRVSVRNLHGFGTRIPDEDAPSGDLIRSRVRKGWLLASDIGLPTTEQKKDPTETKQFKQWFGNSKAVDENGEPLTLYHGTTADFSEFAVSHNAHARSLGIPVHFFTDNTDLANAYAGEETGAKVMPVYVKLENPLVIDAKGGEWVDALSEAIDEMRFWRTPIEKEFMDYRGDLAEKYAYEWEFEPEFELPAGEQEKLTALSRALEDDILANRTKYRNANKHPWKYDGLIIKGVYDWPGRVHSETTSYSPYSTVYGVFDSQNIKSAIGNRGTFDPASKDIRMASGDWVPYEGPRDGKGWKNTRTGDVRYQDDKPSDRNGKDDSGKPKIVAGSNKRGYYQLLGYEKPKDEVDRARKWLEDRGLVQTRMGGLGNVWVTPEYKEVLDRYGLKASHTDETLLHFYMAGKTGDKKAILKAADDHVENMLATFDEELGNREELIEDLRVMADEELPPNLFNESDAALFRLEFGEWPRGHFPRKRKVHPTKTKQFKQWFGNSKIVDDKGNPKKVFHGTRSDFSEFKRPKQGGLINHFLGPHFAVDPSVTDAFTIGQYARNTTAWAATEANQLVETKEDSFGKKLTRLIEPGGRIMPVYLKIENPYVIPPREEYNLMDQSAIAIEAAGSVFRKRPDLFKKYVKSQRLLSDEEAENAWETLADNKAIPRGSNASVPQEYIDDHDGDGFKGFVANYGAEFGPEIGGTRWNKFIAQTFVDILRSQGYDGIQYKNTSGNEVKEGADPTTYIVFDSTQVKSATGNRGTFDPNDPDIRMSIDCVMMAVAHAPAGGITINGKFYAGGQFIPGEEVDEALFNEEITPWEHRQLNKQYKSLPGQMELPFSEPLNRVEDATSIDWRPVDTEGVFDEDKSKELMSAADDAFTPYMFGIKEDGSVDRNAAYSIKTGPPAGYPEEAVAFPTDVRVANKMRSARALTDYLINDEEFVRFAVHQVENTSLVKPAFHGMSLAHWKTGPVSTYNRIAVRSIVQRFIDTWAQSSSNSTFESMVLQKAAKELFDLPGEAFESALKNTSRHFRSKMEVEYEALAKPAKKFLRAMYDTTQKHLKERGVKEVMLFRGMTFHDIEDFIGYTAKSNRWDEDEFTSNPMSSWSSDIDTARAFAVGPIPVLLAARIPASRIISVPVTGLGASPEHEFVTLAGNGVTGYYIGEPQYSEDEWGPAYESPLNDVIEITEVVVEPVKHVNPDGTIEWEFPYEGYIPNGRFRPFYGESFFDPESLGLEGDEEPEPRRFYFYDDERAEDEEIYSEDDNPGNKEVWWYESDPNYIFDSDPGTVIKEGVYEDHYGNQITEYEYEAGQRVEFPPPWI